MTELKAKSLDAMRVEVFEFERMKGWQPNDNRFLESCMLMATEISEAVDSYRTNRFLRSTSEQGKPEDVASELADVFIRLLSTWNQFLTPLGYDLEQEYERKMAYNRTRPWRHGGKSI